MSGTSNNLQWLQSLYSEFTNGDWEHSYGVEITTLDNPGWRLKFNLHESALEHASFVRLEVERSEHDWLHCWTAESSFQAACGPHNLDEVLTVFREWVAQSGVSISTGSQI